MIISCIEKPEPTIAVQWTGDNHVEVTDICPAAIFEEDELVIPSCEGFFILDVGDYVVMGSRPGCYHGFSEETFRRYYDVVETYDSPFG